jgi:integrase
MRGHKGAGDSAQGRTPGKTRWERMERSSLTLERLGALHAAAYRAENKSERTVQWHLDAIKRYGAWVCDELKAEPTLAAFTLDNMRLFVENLREQPRWIAHPGMPAHTKEQPIKASTVSWYVRGLRAFATWLYEEGHTKTNALARLKDPAVPDEEVDILTQEEITAILRQFDPHTEIGARDLAIFTTMLDTGVRAGKLVGLRLKDLRLDQGYPSSVRSGRIVRKGAAR